MTRKETRKNQEDTHGKKQKGENNTKTEETHEKKQGLIRGEDYTTRSCKVGDPLPKVSLAYCLDMGFPREVFRRYGARARKGPSVLVPVFSLTNSSSAEGIVGVQDARKFHKTDDRRLPSRIFSARYFCIICTQGTDGTIPLRQEGG